MYRGELHIHGVVDQPPDEDGRFSRIDYPSALPVDVQNRMIRYSETFLRHVGFDNGCFNAEFMWDADRDQLWIIEFNTRVSQSHSDLFTKVDGMSNHEVALDVAMGTPPSLPTQQGPFAVATKTRLTHDRDGVVTRVPDQHDIDRLLERFPDTEVLTQVSPGDRLSELPNQEGERFELAEIYLGAQDRDGIQQGDQACKDLLTFAFDPVD